MFAQGFGQEITCVFKAAYLAVSDGLAICFSYTVNEFVSLSSGHILIFVTAFCTGVTSNSILCAVTFSCNSISESVLALGQRIGRIFKLYALYPQLVTAPHTEYLISALKFVCAKPYLSCGSLQRRVFGCVSADLGEVNSCISGNAVVSVVVFEHDINAKNTALITAEISDILEHRDRCVVTKNGLCLLAVIGTCDVSKGVIMGELPAPSYIEFSTVLEVSLTESLVVCVTDEAFHVVLCYPAGASYKTIVALSVAESDTVIIVVVLGEDEHQVTLALPCRAVMSVVVDTCCHALKCIARDLLIIEDDGKCRSVCVVRAAVIFVT